MKTRINIIKKELNLKMPGVYKFAETKREVLKQYSDKLDQLNLIPEDKFNNYSFLSEVLRKCEGKEKQKYTSKILKNVTKLERHSYAPELNKLHFKNTFISAPQKITIEDAIKHVINTSSLHQLKNFQF